MRHTRGPWFVKLHSKAVVRQDGKKHILQIDEHYDSTIGPVHIVDNDDFLIAAVVSRSGEGVKEQTGNALLISRSPDLLSAAAKVVGAIRDKWDGHPPREIEVELRELEAILAHITNSNRFKVY